MSSGFGSDFNSDFHVTMDEHVAPIEYNYRDRAQLEACTGFVYDPDEAPYEQPGRSAFLRDGDRVFHTYSVFARGLESIGGSYYLLDETALGRQEAWEQPKGRSDDARAAVPNFAN